MDFATLLRQSSNAGLTLLSRERSSELAQFLRDVSHYPYPELNTRQAEFLLKLRDDKATHFKIGDGLSVAIGGPRRTGVLVPGGRPWTVLAQRGQQPSWANRRGVRARSGAAQQSRDDADRRT